VLNTSPAATVDKAGVPTGEPIWSESRLNELANTYLTDLYSEAKPAAQSETDKLMAKVEEYKKLVDMMLAKNENTAPQPTPDTRGSVIGNLAPPVVTANIPVVYQDKQEVIAELEKRGITHDKRKSKADLEKLLV
jgi:hypothetical protein